MVVHSALPASLTAAADAVLVPAGLGHAAHGVQDPVGAASGAAGDISAIALLGPFRSADVSEAVAATAPAGLPLIAPMATWAGVTRDDEPGCDDAADHRGTVFRLLARDTEVAARLATEVRRKGHRALVISGEHDYGRQLDGQLGLAGLPRAEDVDGADLIVLCGLAGAPEVAYARSLAPVPLVAFDGIQGADLGPGRDVRLALPFAPSKTRSPDEVFAGIEQATRAALLVVEAVGGGSRDRSSLLAALRSAGEFDGHGDPVEPDVWLWRMNAGWRLTAERSLPSSP